MFLGLIFLQLKNDQRGVQNRQGVLFITLMQVNFGYIFSVVNVSLEIGLTCFSFKRLTIFYDYRRFQKNCHLFTEKPKIDFIRLVLIF